MIIATLIGAGAIGGAAGVASQFLEVDEAGSDAAVERAAGIASQFLGHDKAGSDAALAYADPIYGCTATDGDTIRCGDERIRLLGIDAPELPGHCRPGRDCAPGDPYASTSSLVAAMSGRLTIKRIGEDHYGRTLAMVAGMEGDLSCWQLHHDQVIYKVDWDDGLNVARTCPRDVL